MGINDSKQSIVQGTAGIPITDLSGRDNFFFFRVIADLIRNLTVKVGDAELDSVPA